MSTNTHDIIVIGAGAAGSSAANTALSKGAHVALVERDKIGGTCLNYGCDPTKTLLHIAHLLYQVRHSEHYGLTIPSASADWSRVQAYTQDVIRRIRGGTSSQASAELTHKGIEVIHGEARFISPYALRVSDRSISAPRIIIAAGSQPVIPPVEGLAEAGFLTNVEALALPALPRRLAVVGGGAIGIEFAQLFHRFDVEVTVLEKGEQLLDTEDREMAELLCSLLEKEGISMQTGAELRKVEFVEGSKRLTIVSGGHEERQIEVDELLIASGRKPALASLHLSTAGVKEGKKGIEVDKTLRTSAPHIWAAGDVTGGYQFTHVADAQGKLAAHNAFSSQPQTFEDRVIPWVTFTDPPLAHVGKTEEQLRQEQVQYEATQMKFDAVERAITKGTTEGLVKLLVDSQGEILGGHVLGDNGDDLLAPIILAMQTHTSVETLAKTIFPYPTLSEAVRWAASRFVSQQEGT
ncbi:mercuric reductase [Reticulibacter mediterranei]|uniref:Mercuric reductase n=1 Tax=Reticulibacter mediterranei TaxID=2778369 RepID=A0A8J3MZL3_9CHLR|nr:NAD(P)/FAD-dependent oxidoreductase [Reticulibacter mediterranei]GHO90578.1 mercuric reductase [Reticulibacter mediterranei]